MSMPKIGRWRKFLLWRWGHLRRFGGPVVRSCCDEHIGMMSQTNLKGVQPRLLRGGRKTEEVAVAKVIGQCAQGLVKLSLVVEVAGFSTRQIGHLSGQIFAHRVDGKTEWCAQVEVGYIVLIPDGDGLVRMSRPCEGLLDCDLLRREGEAVDGGVGLSDGADDIFEPGLAAVVVCLADEQDGATGIRGLLLQ